MFLDDTACNLASANLLQFHDKAGNGFMMVDDMKHVLTNMGTDRLTPEEADMMLKLADKDGDGVCGILMDSSRPTTN